MVADTLAGVCCSDEILTDPNDEFSKRRFKKDIIPCNLLMSAPGGVLNFCQVASIVSSLSKYCSKLNKLIETFYKLLMKMITVQLENRPLHNMRQIEAYSFTNQISRQCSVDQSPLLMSTSLMIYMHNLIVRS